MCHQWPNGCVLYINWPKNSIVHSSTVYVKNGDTLQQIGKPRRLKELHLEDPGPHLPRKLQLVARAAWIGYRAQLCVWQWQTGTVTDNSCFASTFLSMLSWLKDYIWCSAQSYSVWTRLAVVTQSAVTLHLSPMHWPEFVFRASNLALDQFEKAWNLKYWLSRYIY